MSLKKRAEALESFQTDAEMQVFFLTKACGAMGVNLTAASHIFILEPSWNPVWEKQAICRAHRLGQKGPITIKRYFCKGVLLSDISSGLSTSSTTEPTSIL